LVKPSEIPILITSCVYPHDLTAKLIDPADRINYTIEGVAKWLEYYPDIKLIICDGSNFDFSVIARTIFPNNNIEVLHFQQSSEKVKIYGKGYGEGEIIEYALKNSKYISQYQCFAKCTAKLWIKDYIKCVSAFDGPFNGRAHFSNVFTKLNPKLEYIDTRFYIVDKIFYIDILLNLYKKTNLQENISIEDIFLDEFIKIKLKKFLFDFNIRIYGVSGGSGKYYNNKFYSNLKGNIKIALLKKCKNIKELFISSHGTRYKKGKV